MHFLSRNLNCYVEGGGTVCHYKMDSLIISCSRRDLRQRVRVFVFEWRTRDRRTRLLLFYWGLVSQSEVSW